MGVVKKFSVSGKRPMQKGGNYFKPGEYLCEITGIKYVDVRNKAPMFVLETRLLEVVDAKDGASAGATRNWCQMTDTDWAAPNILECVMAAYGEDPSDAAALREDQPDYWDNKIDEAMEKGTVIGNKVFVVCVSKLKKNAKDEPQNYRDVCSFLPYSE